MGFKDLRDFIHKLEAEGELKRIKAKVDWEAELAAIVGRIYSQRGPALLFENIKGHENTWCRKILTGGLSTRSRAALMMGMPKDASHVQLVQLLRKRLKEPVKPVTVKTGPVKDNIIRGSDIDLFQIPVPKWHPLDGGRYINTWCGVATMNPDNGEHNVGMYRGMVSTKNKIGVLLVPAQGWGGHYARYQQMGKPMPVACIYGWDPTLGFTASSPITSMTEYEAMGSIRQEPVPLVKCETSDLLVPASAEIVVEGTISPDPESYEMEGPFGEWTGYYGMARKRPVMEVKCITHRNDPIFRGNLEGLKPGLVNEDAICAFIALSALLWETLDAQGIPGILDVVPAPWTIVKIRKTYQGQPRQIAAAIWGSRVAVNFAKTVVVVEEDVDIYNMRAIQLAVQTYVDAGEDIVIFPENMGSSLDVAIAQSDKDELLYGASLQNKMLIDATTNWRRHPVRKEWGNRRLPPICTEQLPEVEQLVSSRWREYGFTSK
jgi:4-hydroxy-3-polyprenylbenzoate decarboxylase